MQLNWGKAGAKKKEGGSLAWFMQEVKEERYKMCLGRTLPHTDVSSDFHLECRF
jgi:hypothetical protein